VASSFWSAAVATAAIGFGCVELGACAKAAPFSCDLNSDCEVGSYCSDDGTCKQECVDAARDCPMGYVCSENGHCEFHGGSGGSSSTGTAAQGSTTSNGNTGASSGASMTTTSSATSSSSGMMGKGELDTCFADAECDAPLLCRAMTKGGGSRCTRTCASDATCPAGFRCDDPGDGTLVCLMSDVGRMCTGPASCNFGCLTGPKTCTAKCATGADCPNGWGCESISGQNVCVKAEAYCDATDASACVVPAACDTTSPQLVVSGCTLACNTAADCPRRAAGLAPWSCNGLCQRPPDVYGPLEGGYAPTQYACNGSGTVVNLCNDAQHINFDQFTIPNPPPVNCASPTTTDGVAGDSCVDSCRYQGGCPYAFACSAVGQVGAERIGLCLKAGLGEVGSACTKDNQCAFGLCHANVCSRDCTKDGVCPTGSTCNTPGGPTVEGAAFRRCE
jgi:hypothetical protein